MNIDSILDLMDETLDNAKSVPLTGGKVLVDLESFRNMISDIRLNMPSEVKQAKLIVKDRMMILSDAKKEGEELVKKGEERAKFLVSDEEIVKQAQAKAQELITEAQNKSKELRTATNQYVDKCLDELEELLRKNAAEIKNTRAVVKQSK